MNMATHLSINNPKDLHAVNDLIHDCYFDIDEIAFHRSSSVLSFRFRRLVTKGKFWWRDIISTSKMRPAIEGFLRIHHVDSYSVDDTQKLGTNSFNVLTYDPSARCVLVQGNVPMDIRIFVHQFEVSVEVTDNAFEPVGSQVVQP
jgi:hypothetical protein